MSRTITNIITKTITKAIVPLGAVLNQWYGAEWDTSESSPLVTRIASSTAAMDLHAVLPIQSAMKGCLLNADGTVNYYLKTTDWTKKANNDASDLSGTDGQVMVEIPAYYRKFETDGNTRRIKISTYELTGYTLVPKMYISAFEASLNRTNSKLASVVNASADYRGGNNNGALDGAVNSLLGKPATSISRTNYRTYARNNGTGWQMNFYNAHKNMWWLFMVEFANRNSQSPVNATLTAEGYKQGGLGNGVTTANGTEWSNFSGYYPFVNCGASNSLGNNSGEVDTVIADFGGAGVDRTFKVNRYRGIEMPFGHIWKNIDGINIKIQAVADGNESQLWTADNLSDWNDSNYTNYENKGLSSRANGYMSEALFGSDGEFVPKVATGGSTTYYCDYFYTNLPASGESLRTLLVGGGANDGAGAGFVFSDSRYSPSYAIALIGSRLCFLGA